jgi:hypothetical protein
MNSGGTGFVHASGKIITASDVVKGCAMKDLELWPISNHRVRVTKVITDEKLDIAALEPAESIGPGLHLHNGNVAVGALIATWGYPSGYPGVKALLTVGYLAGPSGGPVRLWINGAFNNGNSGGPVLLAETSEVQGIVSARLASMPASVESAVRTLESHKSGVTNSAAIADGKATTLSEGQAIATVLQYLHSQTQLVIGSTVTAADIAAFLKSNGISP